MILRNYASFEKVRQDFVANVSHELRTPVSTIRGYAETLLEGALEDKAHAREFLRIIYDDAERLSKLINDLLDLSRIESGKMKLALEECSLETVVDKVLTGMDKGGPKEFRYAQERYSAAFGQDQDRWRRPLPRCFLIWLENAVKYNNAGGSVTIAARETDRGVEVSVADTGIGIPAGGYPKDL